MTSHYDFLFHPLELIASLWAPPPQLPVAPGMPATAVPDAVIAPHGICGWVPSETGSPDWVCQSMGQIMPGVVFVVSLAVVAVTLLFVMRYLMRSLSVAAELVDLQRALDRHPAVPPTEWARARECEQVLAALMSSGKRVPPIATLGRRIKAALLPCGDSADQLVLRRPVNALAEDSRAMDAWTGRALAEVLPNWLTAIGLTTTFIAILLGLQHVKVLENMEVKGIAGLVNGLAGKFFSSIVALSCAVSISIVNHYLGALIGGRWNRALEKLDELLPHLSAERLLLELSRRRERER